MRIRGEIHSLKLSKPFGISRGQKTTADVLRVEVEKDGVVGRGEGVPYARYGDTAELALKQIQSLPAVFDRESLVDLLPRGSARNAIDCALWDLEANTLSTSVGSMLGMGELASLTMGYTVSLASTKDMIADAAEHSHSAIIKIKLGSEHDRDALLGIRKAAPNSRLIVDVNEGWDLATLKQMLPVLEDTAVELLEQPLPSELDGQLQNVASSVPLCADESNYPGRTAEELAKNFSVINFKLDKSGGLTSALREIEAAREAGLGIMVGCMVSSSLGIAPAFIAAQSADYSDLDGFLTVESDELPKMVVKEGMLSMPLGLWGLKS